MRRARRSPSCASSSRIDGGAISCAHAECGARNRPAMGTLPGNGRFTVGKRQLEPALILEKNISLV